MTTTSLYQKYRPKKFEEIIGQDSIVSTIQAQIDQQKLAHAYLFYGTRGLGKTTTARLMAKALGIAEEDLYEIDAASNRGIDDIREIRDGVKSRPFSSPYKMYLIDEVHMLTKDAFNALLKTLEEPPKYVIFVLATTELHKVPDTIKSRTQLFTFKAPTDDDLLRLIDFVATAESIKVNEVIKKQFIREANGSYRDLLSVLQRYQFNPSGFVGGESVETLAKEMLNSIVLSDGDLKANIAAKIQSTPDPKVLFQTLLELSSQTLFQKLSGKGGEDELVKKINSNHVKLFLSYRQYFSQLETNSFASKAALLSLLAETQ